MTPSEFSHQLSRIQVVCGKTWDAQSAAQRTLWIDELRRRYESLDAWSWSQAVSLVIDTHRDAKHLPLPVAFSEALASRRDGPRAYVEPPPLTRDESRAVMIEEAMLTRPEQARAMLAGKNGPAMRKQLDPDIVGILEEIAAQPDIKDSRLCISGPKCPAGPKCIEHLDPGPKTG